MRMFTCKILSILLFNAVILTTSYIFAILMLPESSLLHVSYALSPPYPPSSVITNLEWAPTGTIVRISSGNDTWPITWADDDKLYTAYGDGKGFVPNVPTKLSLGFASVTGSATNFVGSNIHPSTGEQTGDGSSGKKASGMLMVDGVLYMWVRNANNNGQQCQLAWSTDHAVTWTFSSWKFEEFGYCTFLNFGKNYEGSRDNYVYMYYPNTPSAYSASSSMILTRVDRSQITSEAYYEFFKEIDINGNPVWTNDITQRGAVFTHISGTGQPRALRSGISYNPVIKRYLWWQQAYDGTADTR